MSGYSREQCCFIADVVKGIIKVSRREVKDKAGDGVERKYLEMSAVFPVCFF